MAPHQKGAQEQGARLVFTDESGFSKTPNVRRSWSPKGKTPVIHHDLDRQRLNIIASIDCEPDGSDPNVLFYMQPESIRSEEVIVYLDALHQEIPGKIVLLWDGLSSHHSKIVKEHIARCRDWLRVERFPSYAPELNPVEYLFSALKAKDTANLCAVSIDHIARKLEDAADRVADKTSILKGFLRASKLLDPDGCT